MERKLSISIASKELIQKFLDELTVADNYDEAKEMSIFNLPGRSALDMSVTRCTTSAMLVAEEFRGTVYGYEIYKQPWVTKDIVGYKCGGHDFAVVGNFLVDWWSVNVEDGTQSIFDINNEADRETMVKLYAPVEFWNKVHDYTLTAQFYANTQKAALKQRL